MIYIEESHDLHKCLTLHINTMYKQHKFVFYILFKLTL